MKKAGKDREIKTEQRDRELCGRQFLRQSPSRRAEVKDLLLISNPLHPVCVFSPNPSGDLSE